MIFEGCESKAVSVTPVPVGNFTSTVSNKDVDDKLPELWEKFIITLVLYISVNSIRLDYTIL